MLDFITKSVSKMFGNKSERDIRDIQPIVQKIHDAYETIKTLDNDGLREKTIEFKKRIQDYIADENKHMAELRAAIDSNFEMDVTQKEQNYDTIDQLKKTVTKKIEEALNDVLPEAFAVMKETAKRFTENPTLEVTATQMDRDMAAKRDSVEIKGNKAIFANNWIAAGNRVTWDMVHYDVQLIGGIVLHQGKISEMGTGEGKTLVATLPVYLNALSGMGLHLVTVNNYLSKRDSEWMGPLFEFHGLTVDCIDKHEPNSEERRQAYLADITYGTNNEFGFDYLRDNMARNPEDLVQRPHNYAIVDEVDSVLIDDARTPLIISGPTPKGDVHEFFELKPKIEKLVNAQRNYVNTVLADAKKILALNDPKKNEEKR